MDKIKFIYEQKNMYTETIEKTIVMDLDNIADFHSLIEEFRFFCLAIGYTEHTVNSYLDPECEEPSIKEEEKEC